MTPEKRRRIETLKALPFVKDILRGKSSGGDQVRSAAPAPAPAPMQAKEKALSSGAPPLPASAAPAQKPGGAAAAAAAAPEGPRGAAPATQSPTTLNPSIALALARARFGAGGQSRGCTGAQARYAASWDESLLAYKAFVAETGKDPVKAARGTHETRLYNWLANQLKLKLKAPAVMTAEDTRRLSLLRELPCFCQKWERFGQSAPTSRGPGQPPLNHQHNASAPKAAASAAAAARGDASASDVHADAEAAPAGDGRRRLRAGKARDDSAFDAKVDAVMALWLAEGRTPKPTEADMYYFFIDKVSFIRSMILHERPRMDKPNPARAYHFQRVYKLLALTPFKERVADQLAPNGGIPAKWLGADSAGEAPGTALAAGDSLQDSGTQAAAPRPHAGPYPKSLRCEAKVADERAASVPPDGASAESEPGPPAQSRGAADAPAQLAQSGGRKADAWQAKYDALKAYMQQHDVLPLKAELPAVPMNWINSQVYTARPVHTWAQAPLGEGGDAPADRLLARYRQLMTIPALAERIKQTPHSRKSTKGVSGEQTGTTSARAQAGHTEAAAPDAAGPVQRAHSPAAPEAHGEAPVGADSTGAGTSHAAAPAPVHGIALPGGRPLIKGGAWVARAKAHAERTAQEAPQHEAAPAGALRSAQTLRRQTSIAALVADDAINRAVDTLPSPQTRKAAILLHLVEEAFPDVGHVDAAQHMRVKLDGRVDANAVAAWNGICAALPGVVTQGLCPPTHEVARKWKVKEGLQVGAALDAMVESMTTAVHYVLGMTMQT